MKVYNKVCITSGITALILAGFICVLEAGPPKGSTSTPKNIQQTTQESSSSQSQNNQKKDPSKPSQSSKLKKTEPVKGYCCAAGTFYSRVTETECERKKGTYADTKNPLEDNCGWCCKNGRVSSISSSGEKSKLCGDPKILYSSQRLAEKNCGWCCRGMNVTAVTARSQCDPKRFHLRKEAAEEQCKPKPMMGFCNIGLKTLKKKTTRKQCEKLGGKFHLRFALANAAILQAKQKDTRREVQITPGGGKLRKFWCCKDGNVSFITQTDCVGTQKKPLGGKIFKTEDEARRACSKFGLRRPSFPGGTFKKPHRLPDLEIIKTSYNKQCLMTVTVKNKGGPISSANHSASTIHLSSGPDSISRKTMLSDIDPDGDLRNAGGQIKATTDVRITKPKQATLVWVDTNHQIVESDETNNGDDQELTCKIPLIWCCVEKRVGLFGGKAQVGQMTQGECEKLGGTSHGSEAAANMECGIKVLSLKLPSTLKIKKQDREEQAEGPREMRGRMIPDGLQMKPPEEHIPVSIDRGIAIISPTREHQFYLGETIHIQYDVTREIGAGDISLSLQRSSDDTEIAMITTVYNPGETTLPATVPMTISDSVASGLYKIVADHSTSDAYGESDSFFVTSSGVISFVRPGRRDIVTPGRNLAMRFQVSRRVPPGRVTFELHTIRSRTPLSTSTYDYRPPDDMDLSREYSAEIPVPVGTECRDCIISANHTTAMGSSNAFEIRPPSVSVRQPRGGDHWESCSGGAVYWLYIGDTETIPESWDIEFLRDGTRQFLFRSICSDRFESFGYPSWRSCTERVVTPCLPTGNYTVRVSGDELTEESSTFRIGITREWPMITISEPGSGHGYLRGSAMPISVSSTSPIDVDISVWRTSGGRSESFRVDSMTHYSETFRFPDHFEAGSYGVHVENRANPANEVFRYFHITENEVDLSIRNLSRNSAGNLTAEVNVQSRPAIFSEDVEFRIEILEPYQDWYITRAVRGRSFPSSYWQRIDLGDMNFPEGVTLPPSGFQYRVTVDGRSGSHAIPEINEGNNTVTGLFVP